MFPFFKFNDSKASPKFGTALYFSLLAYIISLFIKNAPVITNPLIGLIFLFACLSVSPDKYWQQIKQNKVNAGILIFCLLELISVLLSNDKASGFAILSLRSLLFVFPLAFCFIDFEEKTWNNILYFYVVATTIASLMGFGYGAYQAHLQHNSVFYYNDNISDLLLGKQAAYFSLYVDIAIIAAIYLFNVTGINKTLLAISIGWLGFINYMLASKMGTIALVIVALGMAATVIIRRKKILEGLMLLFGLIVTGVILYNAFPETAARFKTITQTKFSYENTAPENSMDTKFDTNKWSSSTTRLALWRCGKEIFVKHPVFGTGLGDLNDELKEKYAEKHFTYALNTNKNLHSQYMDVAVSMGISGLLVFLVAFILYPVKVFMSKGQYFAIAVFICIALCLLTENMFERYHGEIFIAFILPLATKIIKRDKKEF